MKRKPLPSELELAKRRLAFKAAVEGMVLLKNDSSCLPLTERRVAL